MKKLILCASLVCIGMMYSCQKDELVPANEKPEWLGSSIYEELQHPQHLSGTFNTYLRLVNDLGYDEVLLRTGSKTIFPANDAAFEKFFNSKNAFGVSSYEQLTTGMKKQLLYTSMLDNAMLAGMLSNVKADDNNVSRGVALKHETNISVIDSITSLYNGAQMPQNNTYWDNYRNKGIHVVYDATKPMLVHFTREQMLANNITTTGVDSDFGVLRGEPVGATVANSDTAYIFNTRIVNQDVTCTNGYVHQVSDVLVPPGNVGQLLAKEENTKYISRILNYHCAPYYDATTTNNYNSWARQNGAPTIDSIFQVRYFTSGHSQGGQPNVLDPAGSPVPTNMRLAWDPGWNQYYPSSSAGLALADMGAMLVPTDEAVENYFLPGGGGAYFIDLYGAEGVPNDKANLNKNLDALFVKGNGILTTFLNNMMQNSFLASVPSKFGTITNSGSGDFMGLTLNDIAQRDGKYDIAVASNGVIYKTNSMLAPDEYQSVIGPALVYPDMSVMNYFASDKTTGANPAIFGADLYYYLMSMKANFAFLIPDDNALKGCYIDPISLKSANPRALEFYSHIEQVPGTERLVTYYGVKIHEYEFKDGVGKINPAVKETVPNIVSNNKSSYKSQVADMLNYNTIVLDNGVEFGKNHYYLTKHGGAVYVKDFSNVGGKYSGTVMGGAQIDNGAEPAHITEGWKEKNGVAFRLDNVIQPSLTSVNKLLHDNQDKFSKFLDLITIFDNKDLLDWAGIPNKPVDPDADLSTNPEATTYQTRYLVFTNRFGRALDENVNFFNGYNYTFYAPNDVAMAIAEDKGLPKVEDIVDIYETYNGGEGEYPEEEIIMQKAKALNMINAIRAFVRYHFQNNSVFADNDVPATKYQSLYSSELGIPVNISVKGKDGILSVTDEAKTITINANGNLLVNKMTRDYEFDKNAASATAINVSSFAAVHEISQPLSYTKDGMYNAKWRTVEARKLAAKNYQQALNQVKNLKD